VTRHGDHAPLPPAKLAEPEPRDPIVRADQRDRVASAAAARLLLVRAPAGYGKTTLIAAAAGELGWRCVWYRLDELDSDPRLFFSALARAVALRVSGAAGATRSAKPDGASSVVEAAARLAAGLGSAAADGLFIILDDYESLSGEEAFDGGLAALLSYLPRGVHLVLLTRARPTIPTGRLALEGGLVEIGPEDLCLDHTQAAEVIARAWGAPASPGQVGALISLTEGWPAGVRLAAAASSGTGPELSEDVLRAEYGRAVHAYLAEQVYARLDQGLQGFLRLTCLAEALTAAVAEEISGALDAGSLLARLEASGAFTFVDSATGEYRYHPLLRSFLRERLTDEDGRAAVTDLQRRTAAVLSRGGGLAAAVSLYLDADDPQATVHLLEQHGYLLLEECPHALLARWAAALAADSGLSAWSALLEGRHLFVTGDLIAARRRLEASLEPSFDDAPARYLVLRALSNCCSMAGADDDAVAYARRAVDVSVGGDRASSLCDLARVLAIACRWQELEEVQAEFGDLRTVPAELAADMMTTVAHGAYSSGDVGASLAAGERALPAVRSAANGVMLGGLLTGLAGFSLFSCLYSRGTRYLEEARRVLGAHGSLHSRVQVEVVQAAFLVQQGHLREGLTLLDELIAEPLMETNRWVFCFVHMTKATALRRAGEPARAMHSCCQAVESVHSDTSVYDRVDALLDQTFLEGLTGAPRRAVARLRLLRQEAEAHGLRFHAGKASLFSGVLLLRAGEDGSAELDQACAELLELRQLDFLGQELVANPEAAAWLPASELPDESLRELLRVCALQVGGPQLVASFADRDERMLGLLTSLARTDLPEFEATLLLQALRRHPSKQVRERARRLGVDNGAAASRLFLELTLREEEILSLLAEGCSNAQIARRLVLSVGTVKTHVHRIFTKTGVHGRLAAAVLYRQRAEASAGGADSP
jgi:ATP/maltotriose-dependent transcriptional regulator MalT